MFVKKLGIESSNISTQTLQRDRHADYYATLALIASSIEKNRSRDSSLTTYRSKEKQKNSSQKIKKVQVQCLTNVIQYSSENMAGCARIMRGYMFAAYENIPLEA